MRVLRRLLLLMAFMVGPLPLGPAPVLAALAAPNGVVGDGTPASCTDAELTLELSVSGLVTFACGGAPYTLTVTTADGIAPAPGTHALDGGGLISLSGANVANRRIFDVG